MTAPTLDAVAAARAAANERLREIRRRREDELHGRTPDHGHPRIRWGGEVLGHVMAPGARGSICAHCRQPWTDALAEAPCPAARRGTAAR